MLDNGAHKFTQPFLKLNLSTDPQLCRLADKMCFVWLALLHRGGGLRVYHDVSHVAARIYYPGHAGARLFGEREAGGIHWYYRAQFAQPPGRYLQVKE